MATGLKKNRDGKVLYLYGITKAPVSPVPRVGGVDGAAAIEPIECGGLICWLSRVSRTDFADQLSSNMENLDWLAAVSIRHQRAVSAIAEATEILPARFGTVFHDESSLQADLRGRKRTLEADFKRIKGSDEWGIKVFTVRRQVEVPTIVPKSGKDYLKSRAALLKRSSVSSSDSDIVRFSQAVARIAVETAGGGTISSGQRDLAWQTSILLKRSDKKKLETLLKHFSEDWKKNRRIECTGPWPPYSFVSRSSTRSESL